MTKKRILFHSEASYLSSGYSKCYREIMSRLHATGKYIIAEAANYGDHRDPKSHDLKWRFYGNMPLTEEEAKEYNTNGYNQFGAFKWESTVLDFKPDIVLSLQDHWQQSPIFNSPLREFYNIVSMSCIDSSPVRDEWVAQIEDADYVTSYTDWGIEVVKQMSLNAKVGPATPPGANLELFKPVLDKKEHKIKSGLDPDTIVFGMIARNQKRKLYPDLFKAFRLALDKLNEINPTIADKALLYIHSSYPDFGFSFPNLVHRYGLSRKVVFTYICHNCKQTFVSFFQDARTFCPKCSQYAAQLPNVGLGVSETVLCEIYNLMDCYIQYSTNEGFGVPILEAASCGVPVMALDFTALTDVVRKLNGVPIKTNGVWLEVETQAYKGYPDNNHLADEMVKFAQLSANERKRKGDMARLGAIKNYDYQKTVQTFMDYFDTVEKNPNRWNKPPRLHEPNTNLTGVRQEEFVNWAIINILGMPEKLGTHFAARLNREFSVGFRETSGSNIHCSDDSVFGGRSNVQAVNPEGMINELVSIRQNWNRWERIRCGMEPIPHTLHIQEANRRVPE